jgi:hypothetical protein
MKVEFKDTFFESVEKLVWYDTKLWKVWEFIRRTIPLFFKNIWRFRKELAVHDWWDYHFTLQMLHRSLTIMVTKLETDGIEIDSSRMKKVEKIKRALTILKYKIDDDYISRAQLELGSLVMHDWEFEDVGNGCSRLIDKDTPTEKKHNRKVYNRARDLEEIEWKELWEIFKGSKFKDWENYDGTDMRGWWD